MFKNLLNKLFKTEDMHFNDTPSNVSKAVFHLKKDDVLIGILTYENHLWKFCYSDEIKNNPELSSKFHIINFPDIHKEYTSSSLWPFFITRIPSINQPSLLQKIKAANADKNNPIDLLKLFGRKTITNPFELIYMN